MTSTALRLFSRAPRTVSVLPLPLRRRVGRRDRPLAGEELPGRRRLAREHVVERPLHHHLAAVDARPGAHLHDVVGGADGVLVVLHDDDRVADVAQAFERGDHLHVVLGMQADARLVEHVEHAHQPRADLRGQADPLRLAAGERARAAVEVQIVEADAQQQFQRGRGFRSAPAGPASAPRPAGLTAAEERVQLVEVELAHVVDGLARDGEEQPGGAQARAVAVGAGVLHHHFVEPRLHAGVGLAALPVAAVVPLDPARDSAEADLLPVPIRRASPSLRAAAVVRSFLPSRP